MESPRIIVSDSSSTSPIRLRSSSFSVSPSDSLNHSPNTEDIERGLSDDHLCVPSQPKRFHKPRLSIPSLPSWSKSASPSPAVSISSLLAAGRRLSFNLPLSLRRASWSVVGPSESMVSLNYRSLANYIVEDNLVGLRGYLESNHPGIDDRDDNGSTALLLAASKGKAAFVKELLNHGADPNAEDADNWTALLCAAKEDYTSICVELLNHGANADHKDMAGWTSLLWACYKGHVNTARLLIEKRADVNVHGQYYLTPLMWASGRGHTSTVRLLLDNGARVNTGDKYGTTALIWACRKSHTEIVDMLLQAGANVDVSGMYCWTPLLVSTRENCVEIVQKLLEKKPNVNAVDKDGCTALTMACKEGYYDICSALLNVGAYVNLQDRGGDTNLIHAAKAGHKSIVEALLKKYADVDMTGKERKTGLYWAVEKNHVSVVKSLLNADPNLETATKEGDTALLRAVRNRNLEIVQLLLDKKARVTAADKEGDTVLHIAMRARSKAIIEVLLRNPKHSQLLYRPNRSGETPYNIDISHQKTILGQIFGARRLNTNEDNENMLGYELYSSALADMLSEPSLSMPITVGLYAKWGSGKSFLLNKLRDEMKGFARQWIEPELKFSMILFVLVLHASALVGIIFGITLHSWISGIATGGGALFFLVTFLYIVYWGTRRYSWNWAHSFGLFLARRLDALKLILQVTFCTPPGQKWNLGGDSIRIQPIRFHFTDQTKVSRSASGENSVVQMIGSLLDSIESDYGVVATRLYRAFRPQPMKSTSPWRFRRFCCVPYFAIFLVCVDILLAGLALLALYFIGKVDTKTWDSEVLRFSLITIGVILVVVIIANLYTWSRIVLALIVSQRKKLQMNVTRLHSLRAEGYLQALKREVGILVEMVQCLDAFSGQQTRLVMVVDGLDSCEQDQVLYVLDAVHLLFTEQATPFITLLAIDPHIIIKAIELNLHRMFNESNIGGHDYLRNLVHLPFYLQNAGLRKVKTAQQAAITLKNPRGPTINSNHAAVLNWLEADESGHNSGPAVSPRRLSVELSTSNNKPVHRNQKPPPSNAGRKLRPSESMESGLAMAGNNRGLAAHDLTKVLLTDDYFSDVNPRSMRRLMNVIYVTGRLLKAFQIEFNWYHLASWVNITEQWPYRTSWIILYCEVNEDQINDFSKLRSVYDRVKPFIPTSKDAEPLLEIDRDEKKFEIFLSLHRNSLQVLHLKVFMPFTIHLDPYLRKVIKEERSSFIAMQSGEMQPEKEKDFPQNPPQSGAIHQWNNQPWTAVTLPTPDLKPVYPSKYPLIPTYTHSDFGTMSTATYIPVANQQCFKPSLPALLSNKLLSSLSAEEVGELVRHLDGLRSSQAEQYVKNLIEHNVSGRVLLNCNLEELKQLIGMNFGDWELFRVAALSLRERELNPRSASNQNLLPSNQAQKNQNTLNLLDVEYDATHLSRSSSLRSNAFMGATASGEVGSETDGITSAHKFTKRQNTIEKQITLEDQAICGALQTLNEEAMEDVLDEREASLLATTDLIPMQGYMSSNLSTCSDPAETDVLYLHTSVVPDLHFSGLDQASISLGPRGHHGREDSISLGSSLASLAELGCMTPARQRTVREIVWPEQMAALNSGLRSRLNSNTSLFRAGSQKSVMTDVNDALDRRETKPLVISAAQSKDASAAASTTGSLVGGWCSEQGSPRRPASLVLSESMNQHDWQAKYLNPAPESPIENKFTDQMPSSIAVSPHVPVKQRFSTTNVELLPEQVAAKLQTEKSAAIPIPKRSPTKFRVKKQLKNKLKNTNKKGSDDSDEAGEQVPLMAVKESSNSRVQVITKDTPAKSSSSGNVAKFTTSLSIDTGDLGSSIASSTSSLDSPVDTTDNEVYKTVIPKTDTSRRENSLALMLNRAIEHDNGSTTVQPE